MFKFSQWSLLKKGLVGLNLISVVLLSSASLFATNYMEKQGRAGLEEKVLSLTDFVKRSLSNAFWNFDVDSMKEFSKQLVADKDIHGVEFFDKNGKLIEANTKSIEGKAYDLKTQLVSEGKVANPNKPEEFIGHIKIYYDFATVEKNLSRVITGLIVGAVTFQCLLSFSIFFFLGRASRRLESSMDKLKETAEQARTSGHVLKELSSDLSIKGSTQSAAVEETSATLNQLSAILSKTVESSEQAFQMAATSYDCAARGQNENESLSVAMVEIAEASTKIQEITNVVDDIAFQTNLLALNAAVEAARAGEHGKGFAVVADAVRTLAQKSTTAAKDINNLIVESTSRVNKGKVLVKSNHQIFQEILTTAESVKKINEQLLASSKEQSQGINQITHAMIEIDNVVNQAAVSTSETASHADKMAEQSEFLNEVVYNFEKEINGENQSASRKVAA